MSAHSSTKVIILSLLANASIAVSKLVGAIFTGSASLTAEAVHSFSDCGNQILLLYAQHQSRKPATAQYPLGHGRESFFWSFVVALLLFSMGGIFNIYEGIHKIRHAGDVSHPYLGLGIIIVAIVLEGWSLMAGLREIGREKRRAGLWQWMRKTSRADLLVVFLENLAALIGLALALAAMLATWATGNSLYDGIGSLCIGALLIVTAFILAGETKSLLIGEAADEDYKHNVSAILHSMIPSARILKLIALQQGMESVMLAYKINPGTNEDVYSMIDKVNQLEAEIKRRHPEVKWQFVELDTTDESD